VLKFNSIEIYGLVLNNNLRGLNLILMKLHILRICYAALMMHGLLLSQSAGAQAPQWSWARGAGGAYQDEFLYSGGFPGYCPVQLDTSGNVYEIIKSRSATMDIGTFHFTNPGGSGAFVAYFVKYDAAGGVAWVRTFPRNPAPLGGGAILPQSMFATKDGYTYVLLPFVDSIRLGNMFLSDSALTNTNNGGHYCIARYDPAGNVVSLHAHKATYSGMTSIAPYFNNRMLGIVYCPTYPDTLDGHPIAKGFTLAILDSTGNILTTKGLGYDSAQQLISPAGVAVSGNSVYIRPTLWRPAINQSVMPIGDLTPYSNGSGRLLLIKFDSLLNFQWFKTYNYTLQNLMTTDLHDNVYMIGGAASKPVPDTLVYDTNRIAMPYIPPFGTNNYFNIAKIDSNGRLLWTYSMNNSSNGFPTAAYVDELENVYLAGKFGGYLRSGKDTLSESNNLFASKISKTGQPLWLQCSRNAQNSAVVSNINGDIHGNIYINGLYSNPGVHPYFGSDSLTCHTPIPNSPGAQDAYIAKLGNCQDIHPAISSAAPLSWCGADSVALSSTVAYSYLWNTGDTTAAITVRSSGTYYVYAIDSTGCYARSVARNVHAWPVPALQASLLQDVRCYGSSDGAISIRTTGGTPPYTYSAVPSLPDTTHMAAGVYALSVTDSAGCTAHDSITIVQPATVLSASTDTLSGNIAVAVASGGTPGYSYQWNTNPAQSGDTAAALSSGWYTVTVTDHNGCTVTDSIYLRLYNDVADVSVNTISSYPNPSNSMVCISSGIDGILEVYSLGGQLMVQQQLHSGNNSLDCSLWPSAVYLMRISKDNTLILDKKISVEH
jgi:hypothetical protein